MVSYVWYPRLWLFPASLLPLWLFVVGWLIGWFGVLVSFLCLLRNIILCFSFDIFLMGKLRPVVRQWLCSLTGAGGEQSRHLEHQTASGNQPCCRAGVGHGSTCWGAGCSRLLVKKDTGAQVEASTHMAEQPYWEAWTLSFCLSRRFF